MTIKQFNILLSLLCGAGMLTTACLQAQDVPSCNASTIMQAEHFLDLSNNAVFVILPIDSLQDDIAGYTLKHEFYPAGPVSETLDLPPDLPLIEFTHPLTDSSHRFTLINNCLDGTAHTGASFSVNYSDSDFSCPAITGLVIETLTDDFINFRWDFLFEALRYRVTYLAGSNEFPFVDTFEPVFEQALVEDSILHTFKIKAVCEGPEFENGAEVFGPELKFSFITIDDIKLRQICVSEIEEDILHTYRLLCPDSTITVNKEAFIEKIRAFEPVGCNTSTNGPFQTAPSFSVFPNPASKEAYLQFDKPLISDFEVVLYSIQGKSFGTFAYKIRGPLDISIPLPGLLPGLYLIQLRSASGIFTQKLILR